MTDFSGIVLRNLIKNEKYARRVLPYLQEEYFDRLSDKKIFANVETYINDYNRCPTFEELVIDISKDKGLNEHAINEIDETIKEMKGSLETPDFQWLVDHTEKWVKERALFNGIADSIEIIEGRDKTHDTGAIPEILTKALSISFDPSVGHDWSENAEDRFEFYAQKEQKIATSIEMLNKAFNGGVEQSTLNIFLGPPNGGKSLLLCNEAAFQLKNGKNVLYISMEMGEIQIAKRIDANLLNIPMDDLSITPRTQLLNRVQNLKKSTLGRLKVKEYPSRSAHAGHFKILIDDLYLKQNFKPDVLMIDYIGICASAKLKMGANVNTYTFLDNVASELRALAQQLKIPIFSAHQYNRGGSSNSDPEMDDIADSFALNFIADSIVAIVRSEELTQRGQIMLKQIKSRYGDKNRIPKWLVGVDMAKMRVYDLDDPMNGVVQDVPVMSNSNFGQRQEEMDGLVTKNSKLEKLKGNKQGFKF